MTGVQTCALPIFLTDPDPNVAFDPHLVEFVVVQWDGGSAQEVRLQTRDFDTQFFEEKDHSYPFNPPLFTEDTQEVQIERRNTVELAGGTAGSQLRATAETSTDVHTFNNF